MAKYKLKKPCYFGGLVYEAGDVVDFGDEPAPKSATLVSSLVEKAKVAATPTAKADVEKEDAVLKGAVK